MFAFTSTCMARSQNLRVLYFSLRKMMIHPAEMSVQKIRTISFPKCYFAIRIEESRCNCQNCSIRVFERCVRWVRTSDADVWELLILCTYIIGCGTITHKGRNLLKSREEIQNFELQFLAFRCWKEGHAAWCFIAWRLFARRRRTQNCQQFALKMHALR
jgi:hypothetical protein